MPISKANLKMTIALSILFSVVFPVMAADTNDSKYKTKDTFLEMLNGPIYDYILQQHRDIGEKIKSGDTNTPLLILEWFINDGYVQSCRVSRAGWASHSDYGRMAGSGRGGIKLDSNQQQGLIEAINRLPIPSSLPPQNRWLLVSGVRSNTWFTQIYDRADTPVEVEKLFTITRARLEWIVGDAESSTNIAGRYGDTWVTLLQTANEAPVAVSTSAVASGKQSNSIQLWDTKNWKEIMIPTVEEFTTWPWSAAALTSNGKIVAIGARGGARAVDLSAGKILWDFKFPFSDDGKMVKQLAFVQKDKMLAVAFRNSVEIWDSLTGQKLDEIVTNAPEINLMKASRDGKLLAVVSDKKKVQIWDLEKRVVIRESVDDPRYVYAIEFSPDGNYLAVSGAPYNDSFVLWDLKSGNKTIIPVRGSQYYDGMVCLAWSSDGKFFAATPQNRDDLIFDAHTWKPIARWHGVGDGGFISFKDGGTLLARLKDGSLRAINVPSLKSIVEK